MPRQVHLRLTYYVADYYVNLTKPIEIHLGGANDIEVRIELSKDPEHDKNGLSGSRYCHASGVFLLSRRVASLFDALRENRLPIELCDPDKIPEYLGMRGEIPSHLCPPPDMLPKVIRTFLDDSEETLSRAAVRVLDLTRWRFGFDAWYSPYHAPHLFWSDDRESWKSVPQFAKTGSRSIRSRHLQEDAERLVQEVVDDDLHEPVSQGLFREANSLLLMNPRTALVSACAALEAGIKETIVILQPQTSWLLSNAPVPTWRLLREYLPSIEALSPERARVAAFPNAIHKRIEKISKMRNRIVHRGDEVLGDTQSDMRFIEDLLWCLYYIGGQDWAVEHITPEFRAIVGIGGGEGRP